MRIARMVIVAVVAVVAGAPAHAGWVDNWFDQKVEGGSEKIKGKDRTYWTGGQFSARVYDKDEPISMFTYEKPRFNVGCGGIDISMGSMSFMNKEYMLKKFQKMMSNAPIIAFDLVMSEYSPSLSNTLKAIESTLNQYSQLQLGNCASQKEKVVKLYNSAQDWSTTEGNADQQAGVEQGQSDSYTVQADRSKANDNQPTSTTAEKTADCPKELKTMFFEPDTSLLDNIIKSSKPSLGDKEEWVDMLRGFIGDVWIKDQDGTNIPVGVKRCAENKPDAIDSLMHGKAKKRAKGAPETTVCVAPSAGDKSDLYAWAEKGIRSAIKSMRDRQTLSDSDWKFINDIPVDSYKMLETITRIGNRVGVEGGDEAAAIRELTVLVTRGYTKRIVDDLIDMMAAGRAASINLIGLQAHLKKPGCQTDLVQPYIDAIESLLKEASQVSSAANRSYETANNEKKVLDRITKKYTEFERQVKGRVGETVLRKLVSQGLK